MRIEKALKGGKDGLSIAQKTAARFQWFSEQVGISAADASQSDLTPPGYAKLLARSAASSSRRCARRRDCRSALDRPLQRLCPSDVAATSCSCAHEAGKYLFERSMLADWSLLSRSWTEIHPLRVTALTSRERGLLDRLLPAVGAEKLVNDLPSVHLVEDISRSIRSNILTDIATS